MNSAHVMAALGQLLDDARRELIRQDGLRPSHYRVIASVPRTESINVTELADRVGMTKQAIGQFVTALTSAGYLITEADPGDRRVRRVRRTPLADQAEQELDSLLSGLEERWAARVGPQRYRQFRNVLDELAGGGAPLN